MRNLLSRLAEDETDRINLKDFLVFDVVALVALLYSMAMIRYGVVFTTSFVLVVFVASLIPDIRAVWTEFRPAPVSVAGDGETTESAEESIVIRHHWMMLAAPSAILASSVVALLLHATVVSDRLKLSYTIVMVVSFGLMVGVSYLYVLIRFYRSIQEMPRATLVIRIASTIGFLVLVLAIIYVLRDRGVSFDWLVSLILLLGGLSADLIKLITASQFNVLLTIVALTGIKWLVQYLNWRINPLEINGDLFIERSGIIRRDPRSVPISDINDLKAPQFKLTDRLRFPWVHLIIETPAQDQSLTDVYWVPEWLYDELQTRRQNNEKGA